LQESGRKSHPDNRIEKNVGGDQREVSLFENSATGLGPSLTDLTGVYEYRVTMRDVNGSGYDIVARFRVQPVPAPGSLTLSAISAFGLAGSSWCRRRRAAA
jgi:hypothetical protein